MTPRVHILTPAQFQTRFASENACCEHLVRVRWPNGFVCPHCGGREHSFIRTRRLYQCSFCRRQTSLTAGTIFHKSRRPLRLWFWAIYLLAQDKKGCPALLLMKQLDVSYPTAWLMAHKIRQAMASDSLPMLDGRIELDDAYLGGEYAQGIEAWYTGATWPTIGAGWQPYSFPVPAASLTIPDGWNIYRGDGTPGTDADWQYLMHNVDQVQIIYGEIGYAFPIRTWNIGMDNAHLYTVPEPAASLMFLLAGSLLIARLRRR